MEAEFKGQDFITIKIHSPEFGWEKDRSNVIRAARQFGLESPIYLDNDFAFWDALDNHYWPAFYLVDKRGTIRERSAGEMHAGEEPAEGFRRAIRALLKEQG